MNINLYLLSVIITIPFLGMLFALSAKDDEKTKCRNVYTVSQLAVIANIILIFRAISRLDMSQTGLQLVEKFSWLSQPQLSIIFGIDVFSSLLLLAIHIAFLFGFYAVKVKGISLKPLCVFSLLFLSMLNGFLLSSDIFSFYLFFEAMLFPIFMLIGFYGDVRRQGIVTRFFIYNFIGAALLLLAALSLYNYKSGFFEISQISSLSFQNNMEKFIWSAIFISFLSRIPIWPFHFWISSVATNLKNPLVFIIVSLLPLTGIYGLIRFLPQSFPETVTYYIYGLEIISAVTMLFIALIGFINRDTQYKFFAYITVFYIMYMLGLLIQDTSIRYNVGLSFFSYLIIISGLSFLYSYLRDQQESLDLGFDGLLNKAPRLSFVYTFFTLAAVGFPVSALFVNNFLILSELLKKNMTLGLMLVVSLLFISLSLLKDLFRLRNNEEVSGAQSEIQDISGGYFVAMLIVITALITSFVKPLWFFDM